MQHKEFFIESDYSNVNYVCKDISSFLTSNNHKIKAIREIELCMIEALNNVIKHAYDSEPGNPIYINTVIDDQKLTIEIIDNGRSRENFEKPVLDFDPKDIPNLPEGGMGLYIIDQFTDENYYEARSDKNIFTLVKKLG